MFQVLKKSEKDKLILYNVLQVKRDGPSIFFLIEKNSNLVWIDSVHFSPYITNIEKMPLFTLKETNRSQIFYAAISCAFGYAGYDLIYYDGEWKSISDYECIIEGNYRLN